MPAVGLNIPHSKIRRALRKQVLKAPSVPTAANRSWENRNFVPPNPASTALWMREVYLPNGSPQVATNTVEAVGFMDFQVLVPKGTGTDDAEAVVESMSSQFMPGLVASYRVLNGGGTEHTISGFNASSIQMTGDLTSVFAPGGGGNPTHISVNGSSVNDGKYRISLTGGSPSVTYNAGPNYTQVDIDGYLPLQVSPVDGSAAPSGEYTETFVQVINNEMLPGGDFDEGNGAPAVWYMQALRVQWRAHFTARVD